MPKPIPLRPALRIKRQDIIIDNPRRLIIKLLVQRLPPKARMREPVQREIKADAHPVADLLGGCFLDHRRREVVEHTEVIVWAE